MTAGGPWAVLARAPARAALFVDFDGTLAPIVDDPGRAEPLPIAVAALSRLARLLGGVAVVTGRPVDFVRRHVPDPAVWVVGQYGLEHDRGGVVTADPRAEAFASAVAAAAADAEARWPTLTVERKGRVAVTVHWRTVPFDAPDPTALDALAAAHGLVAHPGRMACELRPPLAVDKGTAVTELLAVLDPGAAAVAGDDHGDLVAFDALDAWAAASDARAALRIAVGSEESPPALLARADLVLDGPVALAEDLDALASHLAG